MKRFSEPWKKLASNWEMYTPPGRPSKEAIKYYKKFARLATKNSKTKRALVIGATPELRDLLYELNFEVTIIDINIEMILAMSKLTKHKNPNEIIVKGSWTDHPLQSDYYDIALGDLVLSNVPEEKQEQFLKELKRVLKKNGYWITKMDLTLDNWIHEDPEIIIKRYSVLPVKRNTPMELLCNILHNAYNHKTKIMSTIVIRNWLKRYKVKDRYKHPNKKITKYLNYIWESWKPMEKEWCIRTETKTEKHISPYFKVMNKHILHDCQIHKVDKVYPIWFCKVKK